MNRYGRPVARLGHVSHRYGTTCALDAVTLTIQSECTVGLIGPDGVGKSTLLGIIAGARRIQSGRVHVLDGDMANSSHRNAACSRIAYMPQGLGKNLYPDLSVRENIEFFGRLFGQSRDEREWRIVRHDGGPGPVTFQPVALDGIIMGCRMSREDESRVRDVLACRDPGVELLQARPAERAFTLVVEPAGGP